MYSSQLNLLLVDDCIDTANLVESVTREYKLTFVRSLKEARTEVGKKTFDLIFIDVELPDGDGFKFCTDLNFYKNQKDTVKIMLTGKGKSQEIVYGFLCGADDYITKPFCIHEFKARTKARLKNHFSENTNQLIFDNFEFDLDFGQCFLINNEGKTDLCFTPTEFRLFLTLLKNPQTVFSRSELIRKSWSQGASHIEMRGIDSHISHIRKKIGLLGDNLASVYGKGYAWKKPSP